LRFIGNLLRVYSYIFEAILCLAALAMSILIFASPHQDIRLGWLPWPDDSIAVWLMSLGVLGIVLVVLAATGRVRLLLFLFAITVFVILLKGLFLSSWRFNGADEAKRAAWFVLAAFLAVLGSIPFASRTRSSGYGRSRVR
jgi:small-conductance mechanosensitive channel